MYVLTKIAYGVLRTISDFGDAPVNVEYFQYLRAAANQSIDIVIEVLARI